MAFRNRLAAVVLGASALALSACATSFPAQVSRYQAMPAPQGQTFFVVAMDPSMNGGLQFSRYATLVAQAMQAQGYAPALTPQAATMLVRVGYGVDQGHQEIVEDPFARGPFGYGGIGGGWGGGYGGFYGRPFYSRFGYYGARSPFYYGWNDPFWYSPYGGYGGGINAYTVYKSFLDVDIRRRVDNAGLFEGHAKARSRTDDLGTLVPNLVEAMFTGFPGRSGETVRISVPPPRRAG